MSVSFAFAAGLVVGVVSGGSGSSVVGCGFGVVNAVVLVLVGGGVDGGGGCTLAAGFDDSDAVFNVACVVVDVWCSCAHRKSLLTPSILCSRGINISNSGLFAIASSNLKAALIFGVASVNNSLNSSIGKGTVVADALFLAFANVFALIVSILNRTFCVVNKPDGRCKPNSSRWFWMGIVTSFSDNVFRTAKPYATNLASNT